MKLVKLAEANGKRQTANGKRHFAVTSPVTKDATDDSIFARVEDWQLDFEWLRIQHHVKEALRRQELPDLQAVLFLIGIQEYGHIKRKLTKEEKQDLIHVAVCTLLSGDGYYTLQGLDADGWPHFTQTRPVPEQGAKAQERLLKEKIIEYFNIEHHEMSTENSAN